MGSSWVLIASVPDLCLRFAFKKEFLLQARLLVENKKPDTCGFLHVSNGLIVK